MGVGVEEGASRKTEPDTPSSVLVEGDGAFHCTWPAQVGCNRRWWRRATHLSRRCRPGWEQAIHVSRQLAGCWRRHGGCIVSTATNSMIAVRSSMFISAASAAHLTDALNGDEVGSGIGAEGCCGGALRCEGPHWNGVGTVVATCRHRKPNVVQSAGGVRSNRMILRTHVCYTTILHEPGLASSLYSSGLAS